MPYTLGPDSPRHVWHIYTEESVQRWEPDPRHRETGWIKPLCGGDDPIGEHPDALYRLEEVADEFTGPGPSNLRTWLLGSSATKVCRECAEMLVDEMGLHLAPIQWVPNVGPKRTSRLKHAGVASIHDLVDYYITGKSESSGFSHVYRTRALVEDTGINKGEAQQILSNAAMETWRNETDPRGTAWLVEEVKRTDAPHV